VAAPGLKVNAFATGLEHPRWIEVLPNGDVLVAESTQVAGPVRSVFSYAMQATMRRADALGVSANRITLLRDTDGDGIAERREIFMEGLNQPFGMALLGDTFYVGNTDGVVAFPYVAGADRITGQGGNSRVQAWRTLDIWEKVECFPLQTLSRLRVVDVLASRKVRCFGKRHHFSGRRIVMANGDVRFPRIPTNQMGVGASAPLPICSDLFRSVSKSEKTITAVTVSVVSSPARKDHAPWGGSLG
jgi:hypothetical protein